MFGTPGFGGQVGYGDTDHALGWGYVTNYCDLTAGQADDHRYLVLQTAIYNSVISLEKKP